MIPVSKPSVGEQELSLIQKVFESNWLGMGSDVKRFEDKVCEYLKAPRFLATNTGTAALHLALSALGVCAGDEVIVPSLTFVASVQAITATGAKPVFCDVKIDNLNIDAALIEQLITDRTKVIMPVHYRGVPCDMDRILDLAKRYGLTVVEDAAHAFGSYYKESMIGSFGHVTCFSFDPIKNITCGEGGGIVFHDESIHQAAEKMRILGIDNDTWTRYENKRSWQYDVVLPGFRYHMPNFCAAIGLAQLAKADQFKARKQVICEHYDHALQSQEMLKCIRTDYKSIFPFMYILLVEKRDSFMQYLKAEGIGSGIHYIPAHTFSLYKNCRSGDLGTTAYVGERIVSVPLYADMSDKDVEIVAGALGSFAKSGVNQ